MISSANSGAKLSAEDLIAGSSEYDDSDEEERELTNLNWLLRNQNLTWSNTMYTSFDDDINHPRSGNRAAASDVDQKQVPPEDCAARNVARTCFKRTQLSASDCTKQKTGTAQAQLKRPTAVEKYDIFVNKIKRDLAEYEKSANIYKTDVTQKPPFNYSHIIGMAMLENGRVTLQQICAWIESKFAFFRVRKKWNNSIRHNLSLHHCFRNRKREEKGKGGYWELGVDPKKCDRKRIRNRKATASKLSPSKNSCLSANHQRDDSIKESTPSEMEDAKTSGPNNKAKPVEEARLDDLGLPEVEVGLNLELPHGLSPGEPLESAFLYPDSLTPAPHEAFHQQFELGTIIISTTGQVDEPSCLNNIISTNKFGCSNMIYTEDEIPTASENVIISSNKVDSSREANIHLIAPVVASSEMPTSFTINYDYSTFRPYMEVVDDLSTICLHGNEMNRSEDILDNLLDVCVRDY